MQSIQTLADLIHAMTNSLSIISGHSQHLLTKQVIDDKAREDLMIIREQAERAVCLLDLLPRDVVKTPIARRKSAGKLAVACERRAEDSRLVGQKGTGLENK